MNNFQNDQFKGALYNCYICNNRIYTDDYFQSPRKKQPRIAILHRKLCAFHPNCLSILNLNEQMLNTLLAKNVEVKDY